MGREFQVRSRRPHSLLCQWFHWCSHEKTGGSTFLTREHLRTTASRMSDWYDQKVKVQEIAPGDQVYVLNLWLYQGKCPKWLRRYSDVATVIRRINQVTYIVRSNAWKTREKIIYVDKLKLKTRVQAATDRSDRLQLDPTPTRSDVNLVQRHLLDRLQLDLTSDRPGRSARSKRAD